MLTTSRQLHPLSFTSVPRLHPPPQKNLWLKREVNGFLESFLGTYQTTQSRFSIPAQRAVVRLNTMIKVYESNLRSEPARTMFLLSDHLNVTFFLSEFFRHSIETVFNIVSISSKHTSQQSILFYRKHLIYSIAIARIPCAFFLLKFINHHNWIRSICDQIDYTWRQDAQGHTSLQPNPSASFALADSLQLLILDNGYAPADQMGGFSNYPVSELGMEMDAESDDESLSSLSDVSYNTQPGADPNPINNDEETVHGIY